MREPDLVDFIDLAKDETLLVNDPLFSKSAIVRNHRKTHSKIPSIKETAYVTMADSCKTADLELCVACQKKHPLDKCESIMEKP